MRLVIKHNKLKCNINTPDKYAIVVGKSGVGKSYLFTVLAELYRTVPEDIIYDGRVFIVDIPSDIDDMDRNIRDFPGCLFIVDEDLAVKTLHMSVNKNCAVFAILRKDPTQIKHSYRALLLASRRNGVTYITEKYSQLPVQVGSNLSFDTLLVEDSGAGYEFFHKWLGGNIISAHGKDNIAGLLNKHIKGPNVVVILDAGGCCDCISKIAMAMKSLLIKGYSITLILPEAFEEILLNASFIDYHEQLLDVYTYPDNSTEELAERLVAERTKGTHYAYTHADGFVTDCWLKDCTLACPDRVRGSKYAAIVNNNKFGFLLTLKPTVRIVESNLNASLLEAVSWCSTHPGAWFVTCRPVGELKRLSVRLDRHRLFRHNDIVVYASFKLIKDVAYVRMGLIQVGRKRYIPRGLSYANVEGVGHTEL